MIETKRSIKEQNIADLTVLGLSVQAAYDLQRIARSLHRYNELNCEYAISSRQEYRAGALMEEVQRLARSAGLYVYRQCDPRGWPLVVGTTPVATSQGEGVRVCPW